MKIRIRKTNRLVPVSSAYIDLSNPVFNPIVNYLPMTTSKDLVTDISRIPKGDNITVCNTTDDFINWMAEPVPKKPLTTWKNIKYHIIWWKK